MWLLIDGILLFKYPNTQLWSILAATENSHLFIVSTYCGNTNPDNLSEYLEGFIFGIYDIPSNGNHFSVIAKCFTCDCLTL